MQKIKDSFYAALRDRLAVLNPSRTVVVNGVSRPALLVSENETYSSAPNQPMVFYLSWGEARLQDQGQPAPMISLECSIRYAAEGTQEFSYQDRGRLLEELSQELLSITSPQYAALMDHSQQPAADLGARIFWSRPILGATEISGEQVLRTGRLRVHASTEVAL
jgi:hypothetical protein